MNTKKIFNRTGAILLIVAGVLWVAVSVDPIVLEEVTTKVLNNLKIILASVGSGLVVVRELLEFIPKKED